MLAIRQFALRLARARIWACDQNLADRPLQEINMFSLSSILPFLGHYFVGLWSAFLGAEAKTIEQGIVSFVKTDVGKIAVDAVSAVNPQVLTNAAKRDAAVALLKADLVTAGKDITTLAESDFNLFIEMAYSYVKNTVAKVTAPLTTA